MRRAPLVCVTLLLAAAGPARAEDKIYDRCLDRSGGVTVDMKDCGAAEMERQDNALNDVYRKLTARTPKAALDDLKAAERAWLAFREAQCMLEYDQDAPGTMAGLVYQACMIEMTGQRIKKLEDLLAFWTQYGGE